MRPRYFVLRIYRVADVRVGILEGTVERVPRGPPIPFETKDELWALLLGRRGGRSGMRPKLIIHPFEDEGD